MKIEIANIEDVPELLELHDKAFFAIAAEVDWLDSRLSHNRAHFENGHTWISMEKK